MGSWAPCHWVCIGVTQCQFSCHPWCKQLASRTLNLLAPYCCLVTAAEASRLSVKKRVVKGQRCELVSASWESNLESSAFFFNVPGCYPDKVNAAVSCTDSPQWKCVEGWDASCPVLRWESERPESLQCGSPSLSPSWKASLQGFKSSKCRLTSIQRGKGAMSL